AGRARLRLRRDPRAPGTASTGPGDEGSAAPPGDPDARARHGDRQSRVQGPGPGPDRPPEPDLGALPGRLERRERPRVTGRSGSASLRIREQRLGIRDSTRARFPNLQSPALALSYVAHIGLA